MNGKVSWKIFAYKFDGRERETFQDLSYLLFCRKFNIENGLPRFYNQHYIETDPIRISDSEVVGFQSKYYDRRVITSTQINDLEKEIINCAIKHPEITRLYFFLSSEFSESSKSCATKTKAQINLEDCAKERGISIEWVLPSHFEVILQKEEYQDIWEYYFCPEEKEIVSDIGLKGYVDSIVEYYEKEEDHRICGKESLKDAYIPTYIKGRPRQSVKSLIEEFVQKNDRIIVIYGEPGHGKTSICIRAVYAYYKEHWLENNVKNVFWFSLNPTGTNAIDYEHRMFSLEKLFTWGKSRNERINTIDVKELDEALVFLDGFDELIENIRNSTSGYFDSLEGFIHDFITEFAERSNTHVIITSRKMCIQNELSEGIKNENYISEVPCFELDLMNSDDQDNWLNNYLVRVKNNEHTDLEEVERFIENFRKSRKNKTILKLTGVPILFRMVVFNKLDENYASTVELYDELFKRAIRNHNQYNRSQKVETILETFARDIFEGNDYSIQIEDALVNQEDQYINEWLYYFYIENVGKQVVAFFHRSFYQYFLANHIYNALLVCRDEKKILKLLLLLTRRKLDPTTLQYIGERNRVRKRDVSIIINSIVEYIIKHESYIAPAYDLHWSSEIGKMNQSRNMLWNIVGIISAVCKKFVFSQEFCNLIFSYDCTGVIISSKSISNMVADFRDKDISNGVFSLGYFDGVIADSSKWFYSNFYAARMRNASFNGASLSYCNLGAANMTGIHLENAILFNAIAPHAKLSRSVLSDAIITGANLYKANLSSANLTRTVLTYANLDKSNFDNAILYKTDLKGAKLKGARLTVSRFQDVDLAGADLRETNLKKVTIANAEIVSANFTGSDLRNTVIKDTHFDNVSFDSVNFYKAVFENVTFSNVSMKSARFTKVTIKNSNFVRTDLSNALFREAKLDNISFSLVEFNRTSFKKVQFNNTYFYNDIFHRAYYTYCYFVNVFFKYCDLSNNGFHSNITKNMMLDACGVEGTLFRNMNTDLIKFVNTDRNRAIIR